MVNYNSNLKHPQKPIGEYLVEAGLLSDAQVGVALADQRTTALPFGEIIVTRGWVKEKTIEYLMHKVIIPERIAEKRSFSDLEASLIRQQPKDTIPGTIGTLSCYTTASKPQTPPTSSSRKSANNKPIKNDADKNDDVNWVG